MIKKLSLVMIFTLCLSITSFAATARGEKLSSVDEVSQLLPKKQSKSTSNSAPNTRGEAIAVSILSISNKGGGAIGVVATTALHRDIVWGMTSIYLDIYDIDGQWLCVEEYIFEFPDGNGDSATLDVCFDITNQPADHYYRLRGIHEIEYLKEDNKTKWEGHTTSTDGVFITDTP